MMPKDAVETGPFLASTSSSLVSKIDFSPGWKYKHCLRTVLEGELKCARTWW